MRAAIKECDAVMEPELRELCGELDPIQRSRAAEKFARWADQLTQSVILTDPHLITVLPPPKVPRGFFLVNMSRWKKDALRALAENFGCDLRCIVWWGIITVQTELEEKLRVARLCGVEPRECWQLLNDGHKKN